MLNDPWTIMGSYLTMQSWSPELDISDDKIKFIIAWIRLLGMSLQYCHKSMFRLIGGMVVQVIWIDYNTESSARGKFAWIAVEIDLENPFAPNSY